MEQKYYDGTKLLSMKDINGKTPELYICTTNRTGGKTTYFNRLCVNRFIKRKEKFCLIYRFKYELDDIAQKFFKDIQVLFFPDWEMTSRSGGSGSFQELLLNNVPCGYAISLNKADAVKKYSHIFNDVGCMLFDEFQSETNSYCTNEVSKFISVHTSVARGHGKQSRYVPVYMIGNPISIVNPYYVELGITPRLNSETRFLKGDGFVLEQGYVESASLAQKESQFNRAFSKNKYISYSADNVYLNDNLAFVEKVTGKNRYVCTVKCDGTEYAIRDYYEQGIIYCDYSVDSSFNARIVITTSDFDKNYIMLSRNALTLMTLRNYFQHGCFRFKDLKCKECVLTLLSYNR